MSESDERMKVDSSALLADAIALLRAARCPNCDGSGAIPVQTGQREYVSREMAMDAGDPSMEGSVFSDNTFELEQCQWCDELHRLLERYTANATAQGRAVVSTLQQIVGNSELGDA